jgi:hypothetical protein
MNIDLPIVAGMISTFMFGFSTLPMLAKAFRSKDLHSYSLGNILLANGGNLVHSAYVFSLPVGPIWLLHSFHTITTGLMLLWYLRYEWRPTLPVRFGLRGTSSPSALSTSSAGPIPDSSAGPAQ